MTNKKIHIHIAGIVIIASILPFFLIAWYTHPTSDDFCNAIRYTSNSWWENLQLVYLNWSGRYIPASMQNIAKYVVANSWTYKLMPIVWISLLLTALYSSIRIIFNRTISWYLALLLSTIYFASMPTIGESLYWFTGARVYLLGTITSIFYLTGLIKYIQKSYILSKTTHLLLLIILLFITIGSNELSALCMFGIHIALLIKQKTKSIQILVLFTFFFSTISFFAPGNFMRSSIIPKPDIIYSLYTTISQFFIISFQWITHSFVIFLGLLFFILGNQNTHIQLPICSHSFRCFCIGIFGIIAPAVVLSVFGTGGISSLRSFNPPYFYFLIWICIWSFIWGQKSYIKITIPMKTYIYFGIIIWIILITNNITYINIYQDFQKKTFSNFDSHIIQQQKCLQNTELQSCFSHISTPKIFSYYQHFDNETEFKESCIYNYYTSK